MSHKDQIIQKCVKDSFDSKDHYKGKNKLLEKHENKSEYSEIYLVPALFINDQLVKE